MMRGTKISSVVATLLVLVGGLSLSGAALFPGEIIGMFFGFAAALAFALGVRLSLRPMLDLFLSGIIFHLLSFYWLADTITFFGGFPNFVSQCLSVAFALVSSLQFLFCGWLYKRFCRLGFERAFLAFPLAWFASEFLVPRMFPWVLSYSLLPWSSFAALAAFVGAVPLSALVLLWADSLAAWVLKFFNAKSPHPSLAFTGVAVSTLLLLWVGAERVRQVAHRIDQAPKVRVGVVQGNLTATDKGELRYLDVNLETYQTLTESVLEAGAELVIWPESVSIRWMPEWLKLLAGTEYDPAPNLSTPLLYGGLSYALRPQDEVRKRLGSDLSGYTEEEIASAQLSRYNSAIGRDALGRVAGIYHKRILMPFGEYLPFARHFPKIRRLSPQSGDFTAGEIVEPIVIDLGSRAIRVGALICYEDLLPSLGLDAVKYGADLLVNLTNDAWYGDTAAPVQHHLLAAWRAIETERYLIRATNTGYTGIVNSLGHTTAILPMFEAGYLVVDVALLDQTTVFSRIGHLPHWVLALSLLLVGVLARGVK